MTVNLVITFGVTTAVTLKLIAVVLSPFIKLSVTSVMVAVKLESLEVTEVTSRITFPVRVRDVSSLGRFAGKRTGSLSLTLITFAAPVSPLGPQHFDIISLVNEGKHKWLT